MGGSSDDRDPTGSDLPEVLPIDGSGNDKYYVPPEELRATSYMRHANQEGNSLEFAERSSSYPERTYKDGDKEAYQITYPVGYLDQQKLDKDTQDILGKEQDQTQHFRIKKWHLILGLIVAVGVIVIAVVVGVVFGLKNSRSSSTETPNSTSTANSESSVGGYLNPDFYSKSGAWNGTGISMAAAGADDSLIYVFYQDYTGSIVYRTASENSSVQTGISVDQGSYAPLNGTPIAEVTLQLGNIVEYHVFYVDQDYYARERVMTNQSTVWTDGPLNKQNLKTFVANKVGLSACYHADYYGEYSYNATQATAGIYLWFATSETVLAEYVWLNGTNTWNFTQQYTGINGHSTFGCQTWFSTTEYLFYVNSNQEIDFYWQDNNRSHVATANHPIGERTKGTLDIQSIYKASPVGFTNYLVYQSIDTTIRGVNITFAAENTTVVRDSSGDQKSWILTTDGSGTDVMALGGTQLAFFAVATEDGGAKVMALFQERGDDIKLYTRDALNEGAVWQKANGVV